MSKSKYQKYYQEGLVEKILRGSWMEIYERIPFWKQQLLQNQIPMKEPTLEFKIRLTLEAYKVEAKWRGSEFREWGDKYTFTAPITDEDNIRKAAHELQLTCHFQKDETRMSVIFQRFNIGYDVRADGTITFCPRPPQP